MLLVLAGAVTMALPDGEPDLSRRIEQDLSRQVMESNLAAMWYEAFVDADGKVLSCKLRGVIGETEAAERACSEIEGRRVSVGRNSEGAPSYGSFLGSLILADGTRLDEAQLKSDFVLQVQSIARPVRTNLVVEVDTSGRVTACEPANGNLDAFARTACSEAQTVELPVRRGVDGSAVAYVYPLSFEFTDEVDLALN